MVTRSAASSEEDGYELVETAPGVFAVVYPQRMQDSMHKMEELKAHDLPKKEGGNKNEMD